MLILPVSARFSSQDCWSSEPMQCTEITVSGFMSEPIVLFFGKDKQGICMIQALTDRFCLPLLPGRCIFKWKLEKQYNHAYFWHGPQFGAMHTGVSQLQDGLHLFSQMFGKWAKVFPAFSAMPRRSSMVLLKHSGCMHEGICAVASMWSYVQRHPRKTIKETWRFEWIGSSPMELVSTVRGA